MSNRSVLYPAPKAQAAETPDARFLRLYHRAIDEGLSRRPDADTNGWWVRSSDGVTDYLVQFLAGAGWACGCPYGQCDASRVCKHVALCEGPDYNRDHAAPMCPACGAQLWMRAWCDRGAVRCGACAWAAEFPPDVAYTVLETFLGWAEVPANLDRLMLTLWAAQNQPATLAPLPAVLPATARRQLAEASYAELYGG
jgi:hypothetical protein